MEPDRSFEEFVSARWPMLYRLASLVADDAQPLLEDALVRAYVEWPELRHDAAPEERVRELLSRLAAGVPDAGSGHAGLGALPGPQRVAVVLRCYDLLGLGDIAAMLGRRPEEVAQDVAAALRVLSSPEEEVSADLVRRAEATVVPAPPIETLAERGRDARRGRRRRRLAWAAGVVALVLVGSGVATLVQDDSTDRPRTTASSRAPIPPSLTALPRGRSPRVPYTTGRVLHLGGGRTEVGLDQEPRSLVTAGTWVYLSYASGTVVRISTDEPVEVQPVTDDSQGDVAADPAGRFVAWVRAGSGRARVVLRPVTVRDASADIRETIAGSPACCGTAYTADGMTGDGRVVVSVAGSNRAWAWQPFVGGEREIFGLGNGSVHQVTPTEVVAAYSVHYAIGTLSTDGTVLVEDEVNARQADFSDPLGQRVLYADVGGEVHVRERRPLDRTRSLHDVRLGLPTTAAPFRSTHWEDEEHVLLDVADPSLPQGGLVRCAVSTGTCELAARPEGPHLLAR